MPLIKTEDETDVTVTVGMMTQKVIQKIAHSLFGGVLLVGLMISGCSHSDYLAEKTFSDGCWAANDTLFFDLVNPEDSLGLNIEVKFDPAYKYSNLYLKVIQTGSPATTARATQTFIDPQGNWAVPSSGGTYTIMFEKLRHASFALRGSYRLGLIHDMRDESLCGVKAVKVLK